MLPYDDVADTVARTMSRPEFPYDDCLQEARYALWRESQRRELTRSQAYMVARSRLLRVLDQRPLGSERPKGRPAGRNGVTPISVTYVDQLPDVLVDDPADAVATRVDVERALRGLTAREASLVRALYWEGQTWRQAISHYPGSLWASAREKLRATLAP